MEQCEAWTVESAERMAEVGRSVDEAFLEKRFSYTNSRGQHFTDRLEEPLVHTFLHSQQYRGEAAGLLNAAGSRVPDFDFIFWLRQGEPT